MSKLYLILDVITSSEGDRVLSATSAAAVDTLAWNGFTLPNLKKGRHMFLSTKEALTYERPYVHAKGMRLLLTGTPVCLPLMLSSDLKRVWDGLPLEIDEIESKTLCDCAVEGLSDEDFDLLTKVYTLNAPIARVLVGEFKKRITKMERKLRTVKYFCAQLEEIACDDETLPDDALGVVISDAALLSSRPSS